MTTAEVEIQTQADPEAIARETLAQIKSDLTQAIDLAGKIDSLGRELQRLTTAATLENTPQNRESLRDAQAALDAAVQAHSRIPALREAVSDAEREIQFARSKARREHLAQIEAQFKKSFAEYRQSCQQLLEQFQELRRISDQYSALTSQHLLTDNQYNLHLPVLDSFYEMNSGIPSGKR